MRYRVAIEDPEREVARMMRMTEEHFRTVFPDDLAYFDRLDARQRSTYLLLQTTYRSFLNSYVGYMGGWKYDRALAGSLSAPDPVPQEEQDFYQRYSGGTMSYYYVRSNTYIERLTPDELAFVRDRTREGSDFLDWDATRFVEDTIRRVTHEHQDDAREVEVNFGPDDTAFFAPAAGLVVGCRARRGQSRAAIEDMLACSSALKEVLAERLGMRVSVISYESSSVRRLG